MVIGYLVEYIQTDIYTVEKVTCIYHNLWIKDYIIYIDQLVIGYLVEDIQTDTYTVEKVTLLFKREKQTFMYHNLFRSE